MTLLDGWRLDPSPHLSGNPKIKYYESQDLSQHLLRILRNYWYHQKALKIEVKYVPLILSYNSLHAEGRFLSNF